MRDSNPDSPHKKRVNNDTTLNTNLINCLFLVVDVSFCLNSTHQGSKKNCCDLGLEKVHLLGQ